MKRDGSTVIICLVQFINMDGAVHCVKTRAPFQAVFQKREIMKHVLRRSVLSTSDEIVVVESENKAK